MTGSAHSASLCFSFSFYEKRTNSGQPCKDSVKKCLHRAWRSPVWQKTPGPGGTGMRVLISHCRVRYLPLVPHQASCARKERSVGGPLPSSGQLVNGAPHPAPVLIGSRHGDPIPTRPPTPWAGSRDLHPALPWPGCQVSAWDHVPGPPSLPPHGPARSAPAPVSPQLEVPDACRAKCSSSAHLQRPWGHLF